MIDICLYRQRIGSFRQDNRYYRESFNCKNKYRKSYRSGKKTTFLLMMLKLILSLGILKGIIQINYDSVSVIGHKGWNLNSHVVQSGKEAEPNLDVYRCLNKHLSPNFLAKYKYGNKHENDCEGTRLRSGEYTAIHQ